MNKENRQTQTYAPPQLEVLEIQVEQAILNGSYKIPDLVEDEWN